MSDHIIAMRPRKLRRLLVLAGLVAISAGITLADFIAWLVTR